MSQIHINQGFESRMDYLTQLAEMNELPLAIVKEVAWLLGEEEDFDGLLTALEDYKPFEYGSIIQP